MKSIPFFVLAILLLIAPLSAQRVAQKRAARMQAGMNLSYLDNYWLGTKAKNFGDFVKMSEVAKRERTFADIARAGFKTVRIPVNFGAFASLKAPFNWENKPGLEAADLFVKWALANNLNAIVDLHHTEFDNSIPGAATTERIAALWRRIAERYRKTDPEKVFFELRNEPHNISAADWREQAEQLIKVVRSIAPDHTLVVGFHDWNSRQALINSKPFADANIIYTFHYYDPFIFTHQGATWAGEGLPDLRGVPFPAFENTKIETPILAKGKWVETQIKNYVADSQPEKMYKDLAAAKTWSQKFNVPIFVGEFGSYNKYPALEDRCRHAEIVLSALGQLEIPAAWWEWDGGFTMFEPNTNRIAGCMRKAIDSYAAGKFAQ